MMCRSSYARGCRCELCRGDNAHRSRLYREQKVTTIFERLPGWAVIHINRCPDRWCKIDYGRNRFCACKKHAAMIERCCLPANPNQNEQDTNR